MENNTLKLLHTPGPWKSRGYNGYGAYKSHIIFFGTAKKPDNENYIAKVNWFPYDGINKEELLTGQANAQLITAAPEMVQALIDVRRRILEALIPEEFADQFEKITTVLQKAVINWGADNT